MLVVVYETEGLTVYSEEFQVNKFLTEVVVVGSLRTDHDSLHKVPVLSGVV